MRCFIALGSNLGDRRANLESAAHALRGCGRVLRASPIYSTAPLLAQGAPADWEKTFLNAVIEIETGLSARDLLRGLKRIESDLGRDVSPRWAPRVIDLDLLLYGDERIREPDLQVPHAEAWNRGFVLDPLKDLAPNLRWPGETKTVLQRARELSSRSPLWMGILNLTPDSFSDGGRLTNPDEFARKVKTFEDAGVQIFDLGGESTRPGAEPVSAHQEWSRLQPALEALVASGKDRLFRPLLSVDTFHPETAEKALALGADWINDVSGLKDPAMIRLARDSGAPVVLMHSLTVPADKRVVLPPSEDPVRVLREWAERKMQELVEAGLSSERLIFDPGLGFGKTERQSLEILRRIREFSDLPMRLLVGHSRKSFMRLWTDQAPASRDGDSVGISLRLAGSGVEILRVHEPQLHIGAFQAWSYL